MKLSVSKFYSIETIFRELNSKSDDEKLKYLNSLSKKCLTELINISEGSPKLKPIIKNIDRLSSTDKTLYLKRCVIENNLSFACRKKLEILISKNTKIKWKENKQKLSVLCQLLIDYKYINRKNRNKFLNVFQITNGKINKGIYIKKVQWQEAFNSLIYFIHLCIKQNLIEKAFIWKKLSRTFKDKNGKKIIPEKCHRAYSKIHRGVRDKYTNRIIPTAPNDAPQLDAIIKKVILFHTKTNYPFNFFN